MTKAEIVKEIVRLTGLRQQSVADTVDGFMMIVSESLKAGEEVTLRGFGTFRTVLKAEKAARNIHTGETVLVPAHRDVKFKPARELKEAVAQS